MEQWRCLHLSVRFSTDQLPLAKLRAYLIFRTRKALACLRLGPQKSNSSKIIFRDDSASFVGEKQKLRLFELWENRTCHCCQPRQEVRK
jgi:hypothetical protein